MMLPVLLLLAAAPAPLLEPDPGTAQRLHPRNVTASSFLQNGWNSYEQNYLPPYIADDDPTTAWVEGVKGRGEGESILWVGPTLAKARSYSVFIRSGFQKSAKLYRANARPKAVRLEPVLMGESGPVAAGAPLEATLADQLGWQKFTVPTQARVTGLRLTLVSTYPGTSYDDTCISDLRIYVDAEDAYKPDVEAAAAEGIRKFAAERRRAAQVHGSQAQIVLAPSYTEHPLLEQTVPDELLAAAPEKVLAAISPKAELKAIFASALASARTLDALDRNRPGVPLPKGWSRVKSAALHPMPGTAKVALATVNDEGLSRIVPLLHLKDSSFFEADASQSAMLARIEKLHAAEAAEIKRCITQCEKDRKQEKDSTAEECSCTQECNSDCYDSSSISRADEAKHQMDGGDFIEGPLAKPTAFLRATTELSGDRAPELLFRQTLVAYEGERATVVASKRMNDGSFTEFVAHVLEWESLPDGRSRLKAVTTVSCAGSILTVTRYEAA